MTASPSYFLTPQAQADVEEIIDIWYYRPLGYAIAVGANKLNISPNTISVVGMLIGMPVGESIGIPLCTLFY